MIKKIFSSIFIGILATLFYAQYDPWVQELCTSYIISYLKQQSANKESGCSVSCQLESINFFTPTLIVRDVVVLSPASKNNSGVQKNIIGQNNNEQSNWQWKAKKLIVSFSWLDLLRNRSIDLYLSMHGCHIESQVSDGSVAIGSYMAYFFSGSFYFPVPVYIKNIELVKSYLSLKDCTGKAHFFCSFTLLSKEVNKLFKSAIRIDAGSFSLYNRVLFSALSGAFNVQIKDAKQVQWPYRGVEGSFDVRLEIPFLNQPTCFVSGVLDNKQGHFSLKNVEELYVFDCLWQKNKQENRDQEKRENEAELFCKIVAQFPCSYLWRLFVNDNKSNLVEGACSLEYESCYDESFLNKRETAKEKNKQQDKQILLKAKYDMQGVKAYSYPLADSFMVLVEKKGTSLSGTVTSVLANAEVEGAWFFDLETGASSLKLGNTKRIDLQSLPGFYLDPNDFSCNVTMQPDSSPDSVQSSAIVLSYRCLLHSAIAKESYAIKGELTLKDIIKDGRFLLSGTLNSTSNSAINTYVYSGAGSLYKTPYLEYFACQDGSGISLISIKNAGPDRWSSTISHPILFSAFLFFTGLELQGKGDIVLDISSVAGGLSGDSASNNGDSASGSGGAGIECSMRFDNGVIRLPHTYNFITNFSAHVNWLFDKGEFSLSNIGVLLNAGSLECKKGIIKINSHIDSGEKLLFMHMPILFDHCLFNVQKNVFAMVSGSWLLSKKLSEPISVGGHLFIDSAQMNSALFSFKLSDIFSDHASLTTKSFYPDVHLNIGIETKSLVGIDTPLLKAQIATDLLVTGSIIQPLLYGAITFDSGSIMFPYKPLHITKGGIFFDAENTFNPAIELQAKNRIKKYMVTLYAHGLLDDHQIMFDSNPPLGEEQIMSLLLVGSAEESLNTMMPALLMNNLPFAFFGQGSESFLDKYLKRNALPFTISLVPSFTDQTGRGGLRGGIEITLNDSWRALIQKNFSLSEDTRFELEYFFSDDIGLRAIRDEHRDIGVEVEMRWKF